MTDLQIALVFIGALCVALVWGFNFFQERQQRKQAEELFRARHPDTLLNDVDEDGQVEEPAVPAFIEVEEKYRSTVAVRPLRVEPVIVAQPPVIWADPIIDWVQPIKFVESVSAPALWTAQSTWATKIGKTVLWSIYNDDECKWLRLSEAEGGRYKTAAVALQLVDRNGPVTEDQAQAFLASVSSIAQQYFGDVDLPSESSIIARADALDDFCVGVDVQVVVKVIMRANATPTAAALDTYIELLDLQTNDSGEFFASDEQGTRLFSIVGMTQINDAQAQETRFDGTTLVFSLDVPHVAKGASAFDRMIAAAKRAASLLGGELVDNRNHPLSDPMIGGIRTRISEIQERMAVRDILPGSERALRLFS